MKLKAKILAEYLDRILAGTKVFEYRQIEGIELTDENGRVKTFEVQGITKSCQLTDQHTLIMRTYSHVSWRKSEPIYVIRLGEEVRL